jgi:hypothetical protein
MLREPHVRQLAHQISGCLAEIDSKTPHHQGKGDRTK